MARSRLAAENIRVGFFIQLGYLGEQLDDLLATRALIETTQPDDIGVSVVLSVAGHEVLRDRQGAVAEQVALAGEQRPRNDVRGHVHLRLLSRGS